MFFSDRIVSIKPGDKVLEIGPGGTPHPRADIFLDLDPASFKDEEETSYQRGSAPPLKTKKPIIYYDGVNFPFEDNEFDYVICSHVLEHVDDLRHFLAELFRITKRGYIEFPTILYDYIYDIPVHPNLLLFRKSENTLRWLKKTDTQLKDFKDVQYFFFVSVAKGHDSLIQSLDTSMMQGFELSVPFKVRKASSISQLVPELSTIKKPKELKPVTIELEKKLSQFGLRELTAELRRRANQRARRKLNKVLSMGKRGGSSNRKSKHQKDRAKI